MNEELKGGLLSSLPLQELNVQLTKERCVFVDIYVNMNIGINIQIIGTGSCLRKSSCFCIMIVKLGQINIEIRDIKLLHRAL